MFNGSPPSRQSQPIEESQAFDNDTFEMSQSFYGCRPDDTTPASSSTSSATPKRGRSPDGSLSPKVSPEHKRKLVALHSPAYHQSQSRVDASCQNISESPIRPLSEGREPVIRSTTRAAHRILDQADSHTSKAPDGSLNCTIETSAVSSPQQDASQSSQGRPPNQTGVGEVCGTGSDQLEFPRSPNFDEMNMAIDWYCDNRDCINFRHVADHFANLANREIRPVPPSHNLMEPAPLPPYNILQALWERIRMCDLGASPPLNDRSTVQARHLHEIERYDEGQY